MTATSPCTERSSTTASAVVGERREELFALGATRGSLILSKSSRKILFEGARTTTLGEPAVTKSEIFFFGSKRLRGPGQNFSIILFSVSPQSAHLLKSQSSLTCKMRG